MSVSRGRQTAADSPVMSPGTPGMWFAPNPGQERLRRRIHAVNAGGLLGVIICMVGAPLVGATDGGVHASSLYRW